MSPVGDAAGRDRQRGAPSRSAQHRHRRWRSRQRARAASARQASVIRRVGPHGNGHPALRGRGRREVNFARVGRQEPVHRISRRARREGRRSGGAGNELHLAGTVVQLHQPPVRSRLDL